MAYAANRACKRAHCSRKCYAATLAKEMKGKTPLGWRDRRKLVEARRRNGTYNFSEEWRKKIGLGGLGRTPWNKGKKTDRAPWNKGRKFPELSGANHPMFGRRHRPETLEKIILANRRNVRRGPANHRWKGGITPINSQLRNTPEYRAWRRAVFKRDGFACIICHSSNHDLEADHIKPFSVFPDLRLDVSNGRTLCEPCHKKYGWREGKPIISELPLAV